MGTKGTEALAEADAEAEAEKMWLWILVGVAVAVYFVVFYDRERRKARALKELYAKVERVEDQERQRVERV